MRISGHSRRRFADLCAGAGTVRRIADLFEAEGILPREGYTSREGGQRRAEVDEHEASLDLATERDNRRLLRVYIEGIEEFGRSFPGGDLSPGAQALHRSLIRDGAGLDAEGRVIAPSRDPPPALALDSNRYKRLSDPGVLEEHLRRIDESVERDPAAAIGPCKELVESLCKLVLDDYGAEYGRSEDLLALYKKVAHELELNAEAVPESVRGSQAAQRALRSMGATVQALAEMRNELGWATDGLAGVVHSCVTRSSWLPSPAESPSFCSILGTSAESRPRRSVGGRGPHAAMTPLGGGLL